MTRTLFFCVVLKKFSETITTNQFLVSTILSAFQHILRVLRSIFPDYVISCDYDET